MRQILREKRGLNLCIIEAFSRHNLVLPEKNDRLLAPICAIPRAFSKVSRTIPERCRRFLEQSSNKPRTTLEQLSEDHRRIVGGSWEDLRANPHGIIFFRRAFSSRFVDGYFPVRQSVMELNFQLLAKIVFIF